MAISSRIAAQSTIGPPLITCIAIDSAGTTATVTWTIPSDTNNTFSSYTINSSNVAGAGYTSGPAVWPDNVNTTNITGINANISSIYFFGVTNTSKGNAVGDTVQSINLILTPLVGGGVAQLTWNAMHTPNLKGFNGWYKIYREYLFKWTLIDSTKGLIYKDTITYCNAKLKYKIVTDDASGCQSNSNWVAGSFVSKFPPASPVMDTVSVGAAGNVEISWYKSSSAQATGYIVYELINNKWVPIDTTHGIGSTYYNFTGGSPGTGSENFCVAAFDSCQNLSPISALQRTLFIKNVPDKCAQENTLNWNAYVNLIPGVGKYVLYQSVNGGKYTVLNSSDTTTYEETGLNTIETLCYFVQVIDKNNPSVTASSNIICYQTTLPPPPKFSYLQFATVLNNGSVSTKNQINWYIDTGAGVQEYLVKGEDSIGGLQTIVATVPAVAHQVYYSCIDPIANPNNHSYTYRVFAKDSCNYIIDSTNIGQTMFLSAMGNNTGQNVLTWNNYIHWANGVARYFIYRNEDGGAFSLISPALAPTAGVNTYTDDVSAIITGQGVFGYYIQAIEVPSTYTFVDTSISNIAEAYQDPRLYIPNAFNPNGINKIFKPVGVFVNIQNYDFTIYDRWGQLIFETTDDTQGWDGTFHGRKVEEGVYIYRITYLSSKGEYLNQKGWVMMLK